MSEKPADYFHLLTIRGVPIYVHWSFPAGGLLISAFGGFDILGIAAYCVGYSLLVAIHECGHVIAARAVGLRVFAVEISGLGGLCRVEPPQRVWHTALVYTAGLLAQLALLLFTLLYVDTYGIPESRQGQRLIIIFTGANAFVFLANLIPWKPSRKTGLATDGFVLWKLFLHVSRGQPNPFPRADLVPAKQSPVFPPETRLLSKSGLVPKGFVTGIEILNDRTTPAEFVVATLMRHLGIDLIQAVVKMRTIHNNGGLLVPLPTSEWADRVAAAITSEACENGYSLICRSVDARLRDG